MPSDNPLDDLLNKGDVTLDAHTILNKLLTNDDIALKTELHNPLALAQLKTLAEYFKSINFINCEKTINAFIEAYCEYMVSYKRQGRLEITKAVSRLMTEITIDKNNPLSQSKIP